MGEVGPVIGIDLGTTFSAVAYVDRFGKPDIIPNSNSERITPSAVMFGEAIDEIVVGTEARESALLYPGHVIEFVKREMGKSPDIVRNGNPFKFWGRIFSPQEISSLIIRQLKNDAENHLNTKIRDAVISVPAYFSDLERAATIEAAKLAGLNVLRIINEPTAAALYYGLNNTGQHSRVLVFDLGGGTFDVTILEIKGSEIKVLATEGDHKLGGVDWDNRIIENLIEKFLMEYGLDPNNDDEAMLDLRERAEKAKIHLSEKNSVKIYVAAHGHKLGLDFSREQFEVLTSDLVDRCAQLCKLALEACTLGWQEIDDVVLAGGSTRMPMIKKLVRTMSQKELRLNAFNPDECVALGAAIQGALLNKDRLQPADTLTSAANSVMEIQDVASHSLGMITLANGELTNSYIIPKNEPIPCQKTRDDFVTSYHNQETLDIYLTQGESDNPFHCVILNSYEFYAIPKRPAGKSRLAVTFRYNADGVVEIDAIDVVSSKQLPSRRKDKFNIEELEGSQRQTLDIALLIDCSGSMAGTPLQDAKKAANEFACKINLGSNRIALIGFGSYAQIVQALTASFSSLESRIQSLSTSGSTNMTEALVINREKVFKTSEAEKVIVLLTDGFPDNKDTTRNEAERAKAEDVRIITIGVGTGVDKEYLRQIASTPSDFHHVNESFELETTFVNIATVLATGKIKLL